MIREVQTRFFSFSQNNSGGYFDVDENVCHRVIIEALDKNHAISLFQPMIECQSSSCPCCGDRWSPEYCDEVKEENEFGAEVFKSEGEEKWFKFYGEFEIVKKPSWQKQYGMSVFKGVIKTNTIEEYCQFMANKWGWTIPDIRVHFLDGTKKEFFSLKFKETSKQESKQ